MATRYLIRLDDACATMRRENWDVIENALDSLGIRPIVGVIPENQDPDLLCASADSNFWQKVREWEKRGWGIALHGLHHACPPVQVETKPLLRIHSKSEFVGLSLKQQRAMIRQALHRFIAEGVKPSLFMAPLHMLDINTLLALEAETNIRIIADGHAISPYSDRGFVWIPQQLWHFRTMPFGIWCVCLHPNAMSKSDLKAIISDFTSYRYQIIDHTAIETTCVRKRNYFDYIFGQAFAVALKLKFKSKI